MFQHLLASGPLTWILLRFMITFCSSRYVDASVGLDGDEAVSSSIIGDQGIYISADGTRRTEELLNQAHKKRRLRLRPSKLRDTLAEWIPVGESDALGDTELMDTASLTKRKRYDSSVCFSSFFFFKNEIY